MNKLWYVSYRGYFNSYSLNIVVLAKSKIKSEYCKKYKCKTLELANDRKRDEAAIEVVVV